MERGKEKLDTHIVDTDEEASWELTFKQSRWTSTVLDAPSRGESSYSEFREVT